MCLYDDGDSYGMVPMGDGERRARTEHRCTECNRTIEPGETYRFWTVVGGDADGWLTSKMCAHCWGTIELGAALTGCRRYWYWDYVHELDVEMGFVGNCLGDEGHELGQADRYRLLRTVIGRRRQWRTRAGELLPVPSVPERAGVPA